VAETDAVTPLGAGHAPGKVILLGEHAVVYGHSALAAGLSRGVQVTVERDLDGPRLRAPRWGISCPLRDVEGALPLSVAIERVRQAVAPQLTQIALVAQDQLPLGAGLGSSAALTVACARALASASGRTLGMQQLTDVVHLAERVFHGNPSGVDQATVVRGGVLHFRRALDGGPNHIQAVTPGTPLPLVVALLRPHVGTKDAVDSLRVRRERHHRTMDGLMKELGALAEDGIPAVEKGNLGQLGELMDLAHGILGALGVSSDDLDFLVRFARQHGALGCKLTGAGVGGAVVAVTDGDPATTRRLVLALRAQGANAFACDVA